MFNKGRIVEFVRSFPIARVGYPAGVMLVFVCIIFATYFSYGFFANMIYRVTVLPSLEAITGVTFHLEDYRNVTSLFTSLSPLPAPSPSDHTRSVVAFRNAQLRNDRIIFLQELLKNDGWSATVVDEKEIRSEQITIVNARESHEKDAKELVDLLQKNGLIVTRGTPITKDEKFDIVVTLGMY